MSQSGAMANLSLKVKSRVYANLEKYARSGMGMEKACESLLSQPGASSTERNIYIGILDGLKSGWSIGQSMGNADGVVSDLEQEVVTASEKGGMLEKGFSHLAEYFQRLDRTRRRIRKGLAYPFILVHIAIPVTIFTATIFSQMSPDSEAVSLGESLVNSLFQSGRWILTAYICAAVLIFGTLFLFKMAKTSSKVDAVLNRIPLLGKARRFVALERFCQVFEIFLLSGLKMSDSLMGAGKASGSGLLLEAAKKGEKSIANGSGIADVFFEVPGAFPNDFARGVAAAEESGHLDKELNQWGRFYSETAGEAMDQIAEWTPKVFYWLVLIFVGYMIIRAGLAYQEVLNSFLDFNF